MMEQGKVEWYQLSIERTFERLGASEKGLSSGEVTARLARYGPKAFRIRKVSPFTRFLRQFHNLLIYILLAAAATTGTLTLMGGDMIFNSETATANSSVAAVLTCR